MQEVGVVQVIKHHWPLILAIWVGSNFVAAMPSPNGGAVTGSWWYKILFGGLHGSFGMLPRMFATLFPKLIPPAWAKILGIDQSDSGVKDAHV